MEDDRSLAAMLEEILRSAGYDVELAHDGQLGLHLGLSRSYDVMVLDRGLPAIEGWTCSVGYGVVGCSRRSWCSRRSVWRVTGWTASTPAPRTT